MCLCAHIRAEQKQVHRLALSYFYCDPRVFQAGEKGREFGGPFGSVKRPTLIIRTAETLTVHEAKSLDIPPQCTLLI